MSGDLFLFEWPASEKGYCCITTVGEDLPPPPDPPLEQASEEEWRLYELERRASEPRPYLTDAVPFGAEEKVRVTRPLTEYRGVLHRNFARLQPVQEEILKFANIHGLLGDDVPALIPVGKIDDRQERLGAGEQLGRWISEIIRLKDALELWDAIRDKDEAFLRRIIVWKDDGIQAVWSDERGKRFRLIASNKVRPDTYNRVQRDDVVAAALIVVQQIVNENLWKKKRASPRLYWHLKKERLEQHVTPHGLIGAVWLDFALAIDGNTHYARCDQCGSAFPVPAKGKRKRFCSNRCRQANHRQRKRQGETS